MAELYKRLKKISRWIQQENDELLYDSDLGEPEEASSIPDTVDLPNPLLILTFFTTGPANTIQSCFQFTEVILGVTPDMVILDESNPAPQEATE